MNTRLLSLLLVATATGLLPLAAAAHDRDGQNDGSRVRPMPRSGAFALIGDTPYGVQRESQFDRVIDDINRHARVRFVLHTGDIKAGSERCDDALLVHRFAQYQRFDMPFVLTPGDNEWTDCHRTSNGNYNPVERLARLREIFYPEPGMSTGGRKARVHTQADEPGYESFVENTLWDFGGATIGTVHVVGSNNNLAPWNQLDPNDSYDTPRADRLAEVEAREAAALAWIDTIFARAEATRARGVLIAMQANPNFELPVGDARRLGFEAIIAALTEHAMAFGKPVVIAHGDSHYFRIDKPVTAPARDGSVQMVENITRVENFGSQNVHWVEVAVDPRDPNVFQFTQHIIDANRFAR